MLYIISGQGKSPKENKGMLVERKILKRKYYPIASEDKVEEGLFLCIGEWANGHLAYSRVDAKGNVLEEGEYYQMRISGKLMMIHV